MAQNDTFARVWMPEYCMLLSKGNYKMPAMFVGEELSSVEKMKQNATIKADQCDTKGGV